MRMPRRVGQPEVELLGQRGRDGQALVAERSERSRRPAELQHEHAWAQLAKPRSVALDRTQPTGGLQPESDRRGVLQPRAPDERSPLVISGEAGEHARQALEIVLEE